MQLLDPAQRQTLSQRFEPERPGPQVGLHVLQTGHGACFADRWPDPRTALSACGGNYSLVGVLPGRYDRGFREEAHEQLLSQHAAGRIRMPVADSASFEQLPGALTRLAEGNVMGKLVLTGL